MMITLFYTVSILIQKTFCALIVDELWIMSYVENISTKKEKKKENPRFSCEKKDAGRKECSEAEAGEGKKKTLRVSRENLFFVKRGRTTERPLFVLVGKNVSKKASERNLLRRRVKSILSRFGIQKRGFVVVVKPDARMVSFEELKNALCEFFGGKTT